MRWFVSTLLVMGLVYAAADAIWQSRWTILLAGIAGGAAFALIGLVLLRDTR